jgi:hypothetical protein
VKERLIPPNTDPETGSIGCVKPPPLPQPVLAPLTPAANFLVATIDEDGETTVPQGAHRAQGT